eukprot:TRINITY_DN107_c0_g1_i7.p1 TRINITY_DN107_c0_g1~~TRINITY_DN107_c0_g1_i7.p1  ORF type:complete len:811 (-),score=223.31 TRINITY_DN107_c0_g1_i7:179-2476(-)
MKALLPVVLAVCIALASVHGVAALPGGGACLELPGLPEGCSILPEFVCMSLGGDFQGDGTTCPGACVTDSSCSVETEADCVGAGGNYQGDSSTCDGACCIDFVCTEVPEVACDGIFFGVGFFCDGLSVCPREPVPWVDDLTVPSTAVPRYGEAGGNARYEFRVLSILHSLNRALSPVPMWGVNGEIPGPTIEATQGQLVTVDFVNDLRRLDAPEEYITSHLHTVMECVKGPDTYGDAARLSLRVHGIHARAEYSGHPSRTILPGQTYTYKFPNQQPAATMWYHDAAQGLTRLNNYAGIGGFYHLMSAEERYSNVPQFPSGEYYIPLFISDVALDEQGVPDYPDEIAYAFAGEFPVVNGKIWPKTELKAGKYRFTLLNAAGKRPLALSFRLEGGDVIPFHAIAADQSYYSEAVLLEELIVYPSERYDVVVDFFHHRNRDVFLVNSDATTPRISRLVRFSIEDRSGFTAAFEKDGLPQPPFIDELLSVRNRTWVLDETSSGSCGASEFSINYQSFDEVEDVVCIGDVEVWEFANAFGAVIPMHAHLVQFQVLERFPVQFTDETFEIDGARLDAEPWERGVWKDTVACPPGQVTRVIARFEDFTGPFVVDSPVMEYRDKDMKRQFVVAKCDCDNDGVSCDNTEDAWGCPSDCALTSSAFCGDGICQAGDGETCGTCARDCRNKEGSCCVSGGLCEAECIGGGFACTEVAAPVNVACGDGLCEARETAATCAVDCSAVSTNASPYKSNPAQLPTPCHNVHGHSESHHCV